MNEPRSTTPRLLPRWAVPVTSGVTALLVWGLQMVTLQTWGASRGASLRGILMQWDAQWMTLISRFGYGGFAVGEAGTPGGDPIQWQSVAFFPGYPFLVRWVAAPVGAVTGLSGADATWVAALTVSVVAAVVMAWGVSRLALDHLWPAVTGRPAGEVASLVTPVVVTVLATAAPMGVVYWMPYSESLYTALTVWAVLMMLRRRYLAAGLLTLAAGLTRLTAAALILTLCLCAVAELWRWFRSGRRRAGFTTVARACAAPVLGAVGTAGYILWADGQAAGVGGYFAAQEQGWHSGFDAGAATLDWLRQWTFTGMTGYVISSWAMILVAVLVVASLWPLLGRWLPWQVWLPAVVTVAITLGSDGVMHSRPRLLLIPVLLLLLPFVVRLTAVLLRRPRWSVLLVPLVIGWTVLGFWVSGAMLIDFEYAI
jgi:hypothetical protein